jgi:integrase
MPKLTDRVLAGLTLNEGQKDRLLFDTACPGLAVRLTVKGTRTFVAQWTDPATKRKVREPLGVWGSITIEQAREATRAKLGLVAKGVNPKAERLSERGEAERIRAELALTFDTLLSEWAELHLTARRPRYASEAQRAIRYAFPHLLKRPAARIARAEVVNTLDDLLRSGKRAMAGRTLAYARACFQWGVKRGKVPSNPFNDLPIPSGSTERDRVLANAELRDLWAAAGTLDYPFGPFFRLLILTLQRREEVAGMRWSEISTDLSRWTIPAERMKNARPHDIHLASAAREILRGIPRRVGCDFVFSTTGSTPISGLSKAKVALDAAALRVRSG